MPINEQGNGDSSQTALNYDSDNSVDSSWKSQLAGERQMSRRAAGFLGGSVAQAITRNGKLSVDKIILLATGGTISLVTLFYAFIVIFTIFIATAVIVNIISRFISAVTSIVK